MECKGEFLACLRDDFEILDDVVLQVDKEEYTLKVHVRSEHRPALERLTDMPLLLTSKLSSSVSVDVYQTFDQVKGSLRVGGFIL